MLTKAGGWGNLITSASMMAGPALGAALMSFMSIASIMLVDILGAALAISCLLVLNIPNIQKNHDRTHFFTDMRQGLKAIRANKLLIAVVVPFTLVNMLYMPLSSLFPLLVHTHYMGEAWHNGVVEFAFSGGLLVSSLIVGIYGCMKKRFLMVSLFISLLGAASFIGGVLPPEGFWGFVVCCSLMGASGTCMNVPVTVYIQEAIAPEMLGKVFSLLTTTVTLATPIGLVLAGPLSEAAGVDTWFLWSGLALVGVGILCYFLTRREG
jgi:DHA3 family macrolide efflux protein-like MFS transporter